MKGQYLAIESVATLGMGLMLAMGTITLFAGHRSEALDKGKQQQISSVKSEVADTLYSMRKADVARQEVDLPEKIGSQDYSVALDNGLVIITNLREHRMNMNELSQDYELSGTAEGGTVNIFKNQNEISLRSG